MHKYSCNFYTKRTPSEELRKFFDRYLKDEDNGWENTPKVRVSVLNPGGKDIVDRVEEDFPIPRTQYKKLYLDAAENNLAESPSTSGGYAQYDSDRKRSGVSFSMKMQSDTERNADP